MTPPPRRVVTTVTARGVRLEDVEHGVVLRHGVGDKATDAIVPADPGEESQQLGADAVTLMAVLHDKRNLARLARTQSVVPAHPDKLIVDRRHQCRLVARRQ